MEEIDTAPAGSASLRSELLRFLAVGVSSVAIDYAGYRFLLMLGAVLSIAKACSFVAGAVFGYFANRVFTFRVAVPWHFRETALFAGLYLTTLAANVAGNAATLAVLGRTRLAIGLAFLVATGISTILNYLGMKLLVFRRNSGKIARP